MCRDAGELKESSGRKVGAGKGKWKLRLPKLLATLATLGRARQLEDGRWMG